MSNKTQLQTNNTQLASLIQTLQGKATGGGGELKVAMGTFTPEYTWLNRDSPTVTGIGFKPKAVYVRYDDAPAKETTNGAFTTSAYYLIAAFKIEDTVKALSHYHASSSSSRVITTARDEYININMNDDGFEIISTESNDYVCRRQYMYIAIG